MHAAGYAVDPEYVDSWTDMLANGTVGTYHLPLPSALQCSEMIFFCLLCLLFSSKNCVVNYKLCCLYQEHRDIIKEVSEGRSQVFRRMLGEEGAILAEQQWASFLAIDGPLADPLVWAAAKTMPAFLCAEAQQAKPRTS
jgi:hypothetical protein